MALGSPVAADMVYALGVNAVVLTRNPAAFIRSAPHVATHPRIALCTGDVMDFAYPDGPFDYVIHAATERSYVPDARRPLGLLADDERATRRVLEFCSAAGVQRLLFTSSGAVYGAQPPERLQLNEADRYAPDATDARALYGHSKRLSELSCIAYAAARGFVATLARLFAFIGPRLPLDEGYAAGNFIGDVIKGGPIRIAGDGTPVRSYLYAADLAIWLWHILLRGSPGRAYNVGSPYAISIAGLAAMVAVAARPVQSVHTALVPVPGVPPARYVPDTRRAQTELGLGVAIDLAEAVRRTLDWHAHANSELTPSHAAERSVQ